MSKYFTMFSNILEFSTVYVSSLWAYVFAQQKYSKSNNVLHHALKYIISVAVRLGGKKRLRKRTKNIWLLELPNEVFWYNLSSFIVSDFSDERNKIKSVAKNECQVCCVISTSVFFRLSCVTKIWAPNCFLS